MATRSSARWKKWLLALAVLAAAAAGAIWYGKEPHEQAPEYVTTTVTKGDLTQAVTATGTLNPVLNVQVGSQISGIIQRLFADFNSLVKSNQIVAQLDPATYQANVAQAEGDLSNAKANLELARAQADRAKELFGSKLISASEHDITSATLHQSEAQVSIKEASLQRARVDLARCTIYAPVDGIVIDRKVDVGQTVAASMNAPVLFLIANDLTKMQIDANVSEADVGTVEESQAVTFAVDAFPDRTFNGKVIQIRNSPLTVQNVVTYDCVIEVANPDLKLKPGMTANVSIITAQRTNVLRVPNVALRFKPTPPSTNVTAVAKWLAKLGLGAAAKPAATNAVLAVASTSLTNKADTAATPALTGNESPQELVKRMKEIRDRGEEPPAELRAKIRELYQSGVLQRPSGGGGGFGGGFGGGLGDGGARSSGGRTRSSGPAARTVYLLTTNTPPGGGEPVIAPQPVRVKTGISDGAFTEIADNLKEGDTIITAIKQPAVTTSATPAAGASPFGGGGGPGRRF